MLPPPSHLSLSLSLVPLQDFSLSWESDSAVQDSEQGLYIQVPMYVVLEWDNATQQRVLFEALVLSNSTDGITLNQSDN